MLIFKLNLLWLLEIVTAVLTHYFLLFSLIFWQEEIMILISHILHNTSSLFLLFSFCILFTLFYSEVRFLSLLSSLLLSLQCHKHLAFHYSIMIDHHPFAYPPGVTESQWLNNLKVFLNSEFFKSYWFSGFCIFAESIFHTDVWLILFKGYPFIFYFNLFLSKWMKKTSKEYVNLF